jgi:hypothetical protein
MECRETSALARPPRLNRPLGTRTAEVDFPMRATDNNVSVPKIAGVFGGNMPYA